MSKGNKTSAKYIQLLKQLEAKINANSQPDNSDIKQQTKQSRPTK